MTHFFILGNNPTLSIAEISNLLKDNIKEVKEVTSDFFIIKTEKEINEKELQKELGGTIKIGRIIRERVNLKNLFELSNLISELLFKEFCPVKSCEAGLPAAKPNRVNFGFSFYGHNYLKINFKKITKETGLEIKKKLSEKQMNSRWVNSSEDILSSVILRKNKLIEQGKEFVFLSTKKNIFLGQTQSCQDFKDYSLRDFGRPKRAIKEGMIPPKLAKIMLNLGKDSLNVCFLDPFCGTGTILQEAFLLGFKKIIGTDKNEKIIIQAKENIDWFIKKEAQKKEIIIDIFRCDVRKLSKKIRPNSVSLIVTEPYLGPLKFENNQCHIIINQISTLYLLAFKEFKKIVKPNKRVVIILPVFNAENKYRFLPILALLEQMGWEREQILPDYMLNNKIINLSKRKTLIYSRPNQRILREIIVFKSI